MRGMGCVVAGILLLAAVGTSTLVRVALRNDGAISWSGLGGIVVPVTVLIVVFLAFGFIVRAVGSPVGNLIAGANRVAEGDYSVRVAERGPPMIRSFTRTFNAMTNRLETQDRQRRHLMAEIAHELRTPLAVIQGRLEGLLDGIYPRDDQRITLVLEETRVLARLVEDVRTLAHSESGALALQREPTDVALLIGDLLRSLSEQAGARRAHLDARLSGDLPVADLDPVRIREVLSNILTNAIRYTPEGGTVTVSADASAGALLIRVTDTGGGIPAEDLPKVFDRFYKGRDSQGSGLGLAIARALVMAHGGQIRAESRVGEGTTMTITLPLRA
jgi:signal transduction histidine kinase